MAIDAGGFQGDGGDAAQAQPGDELAQAGRCGRGTRGRCRSRREWPRRRPSGWRRRRRCRPRALCWMGRVASLAAFLGLAASLLSDAAQAASSSGLPWGAAVRGRRAGGERLRSGGVFVLRSDMVASRMGTGVTWAKGVRRGSRHRHQPSQRDPPRPRKRGRRWSPTEWAENRSPAQSNQRAERERSRHQQHNGHRHRTSEIG